MRSWGTTWKINVHTNYSAYTALWIKWCWWESTFSAAINCSPKFEPQWKMNCKRMTVCLCNMARYYFYYCYSIRTQFFFLRYNAKKQLCIMGNEYYDCCFCFRQSFGSVYLFVCVCLAHWQANKLAHLLQTMAKTREKNMNRRPPNIILHTYTESESQRGNGWEKWIEIPSII